MPTKKSSAPEPTPIQTPQNTPESENAATIEDSIRAKAFQLYEERGRIDGHAEEDWLQAECDILSQQAGKASA